MMLLPLMLSLCLYQDPGRTAPSSKTMPEDRTLMFLEIAPLSRWRQVRNRVFQIQAFEDPSLFHFFRWIAASDGDGYQMTQRVPELFSVIESFDQGLTAGYIFDRLVHPTPRGTVLVGAGSKGSRVKAAGKIFDGLFAPQKQVPDSQPKKAKKEYRRTQRELSLTETPLEDSPIRARYATWKPRDDKNQRNWLDWRTPHLGWAFFGRRAAFSVGTSGSKGYKDELLEPLAGLIGLEKSRGGTQLGEPMALMEGEIQLLRGGLRFGRFARDKKYTQERARKNIAAMGFDSWVGVQSGLFSGPEGLREVYQILDEGKPGSFYRIFREPKAPLRKVLSYLSPKTVAFARVGADGKALSSWLESSWKTMMGGEDRHSFLRICRSFLGLPAQKAGEENLDDLSGLTLFVLPASPGAPLPQPGVLLECPESKGEVDRLLETIGKTIFEESFGAKDSKVKLGKLGKGEDAVRYLSFKKLLQGFGGGGMSEMSIVANLFGGGFVSAKRSGPYLILGCNPKDVRRMARDIAKGKSLLDHPGIQKTFATSLEAGAPSHLLDAWVDPGAVIKKAGLFSTVVPMLMMGFSYYGGEAAESIPMKGLPRWGDAAKILHPESIQAVRAGTNIQIEHRGGTLLSPMAWWGFGMAEEFWGVLSRLVR